MGGDLRGRTGRRPPEKRPIGPRHKPITMRKLGDFQRAPGYMLWASCPRCGRYRTLDLSRDITGAGTQMSGFIGPATTLVPYLRGFHG